MRFPNAHFSISSKGLKCLKKYRTALTAVDQKHKRMTVLFYVTVKYTCRDMEKGAKIVEVLEGLKMDNFNETYIVTMN